MHVKTFEWDAINVEHTGRHGLEPHEVEAACRGRILVLKGRGGRYLGYGQTSAGRYLFIVLRSLGAGFVRVITARDRTERERQLYRHRRH